MMHISLRLGDLQTDDIKAVSNDKRVSSLRMIAPFINDKQCKAYKAGKDFTNILKENLQVDGVTNFEALPGYHIQRLKQYGNADRRSLVECPNRSF